ncbi:hypothetical protein [Tautonia plasticadhaerens]|uniref:Uncharacterized protein n=1 Tax=Tautonia plasticadhaerens TaxID=2527974 RepID=A0A518H1U6_9BACT|nr:hypothetical protein [Tautonia plasticadhaerens]QDV34817.1 hypothetical protein ElP_27140 [Tautonia plasticadhaerens]
MIRTCRWTAPMGGVLALVVVAGPAWAGGGSVSKPFKISGEGIAPMGLPLPGQGAGPHWIDGQATHLGRHHGEGTVVTDTAVVDLEDGVITGEFGGGSPFVFEGANGDLLVTYYGRPEFGAEEVGTFTLDILGVTAGGDLIVEAAWVAEFVVQPGASTGKFRGVTGSWIMYAYSDPFVLGSTDPAAYRWEGEGRLSFPKK